jgi:hypothetical protein
MRPPWSVIFLSFCLRSLVHRARSCFVRQERIGKGAQSSCRRVVVVVVVCALEKNGCPMISSDNCCEPNAPQPFDENWHMTHCAE